MNLNASERRLLDAACATGDRAVRGWHSWSAAADLDRIPTGEFRLLPLAFRNLEASGLEDVPFRKAFACYRRTWLANQLALRRAAELGAELDARGIRYAVAGDAAALLVAYPDQGSRPIAEIAVLVGPEDLDRARVLSREPSVSFHQRLAPGVTRRFTGSLLDAARSHSVGGLSLQVLGPADLFLIVCNALGTWDFSPRLSAVADAWKLLEALGGDADWERLLREAGAERSSLLVRSAIGELETLGAAPIPSPVRNRLATIRTGMLERVEYRRMHRAPGPLPGRELSLLVLRHLRARAAGDTRARLPELPRMIFRHVAWRWRGLTRS